MLFRTYLMIVSNLKTFLLKFKGSKLVENFIYLTGLQFFNYLLPLITLPYLINILQPEKFGLTIYSQTVMLYFIVFIDYGFNLTATRRISLFKDDITKVSEIFSNVITTKIILLIISLLILAVLIFSIPKFSNNWILYLFTSGVLIGQVFFPIWLFQGLQEMKYLMYFNFLSRMIFTVLVFVVIRIPDDFIYVNLLSSLGSILVGIISIYFVVKKYKIKIRIAKKNDVLLELKDGWMVFLSNFAIQIYMNSNIIILGIYANDSTVGNYSVAEKVMMILRQLLGVFSQVIYPHICQLASKPKQIISFLKKTMIPFLGLIFVLCILLFIFADKVVLLLAGKEYTEIITLVRIVSFTPFIVALNIPAYQTLLAFNFKNSYSGILIAGAIINVGLNVILASKYGAIGTAVSVITTEIFITSGLIIALKLRFNEIFK